MFLDLSGVAKIYSERLSTSCLYGIEQFYYLLVTGRPSLPLRSVFHLRIPI
jgi:hypothetical protein